MSQRIGSSRVRETLDTEKEMSSDRHRLSTSSMCIVVHMKRNLRRNSFVAYIHEFTCDQSACGRVIENTWTVGSSREPATAVWELFHVS